MVGPDKEEDLDAFRLDERFENWAAVKSGQDYGILYISVSYLDIVTTGAESRETRETSVFYSYLWSDKNLVRETQLDKYT